MQKYIDSIVGLLGRNCHNVFFRVENESEYKQLHYTLCKNTRNFYMPEHMTTCPCLLHFVEVTYPDRRGNRKYGFVNREDDLKKEGVNIRDKDILPMEYLSQMIAGYEK